MRVMITDKTAEEWRSLCHGMLGHALDFEQDYTVATAPGQTGRLFVYNIPTDSPMATWVQLKHADWIDYAWTRENQNQVILDQPQHPFMEMIEDDQ